MDVLRWQHTCISAFFWSGYSDYAIPKKEQYLVIRLKLRAEIFDKQVQTDCGIILKTHQVESWINPEMGTTVCPSVEHWRMKSGQEFYV